MASPKPVEIPDLRVLKLLLDQGVIVICAGGGGIPVVRRGDGSLIGIEAVIDKDAASALLARQLGADALLLLTDVDGVYRDFGTERAARIAELTVVEARAFDAPAGSMGPKLGAGSDFATPGRFTGIGRLEDAIAILDGRTGTRIVTLDEDLERTGGRACLTHAVSFKKATGPQGSPIPPHRSVTAICPGRIYSRIKCMMFMTLPVRFIAGLFPVTRSLQFENVRYKSELRSPVASRV